MGKKEPAKFASLQEAANFCIGHDGNQILSWSQTYIPAKTTPDKTDVIPEHWNVRKRCIVPLSMGKTKWFLITTKDI